MITNDLYQEMILDHYKHPRNCCKIEPHTHEADGQNPLCGDELTVQLEIEGTTIKNIAFTGIGCAISQASASLMTEALKGKPVDQAMQIYEKIHRMLTGRDPNELDPKGEVKIGKLQVLEGVSEFPMRVKCASLAWHTMKAAVDRQEDPISTEA